MTSKDYLSQEEIDALLRQSSGGSDLADDPADASLEAGTLDALEQDALGEIGNITFGSAATALSTLLGKKVDITTPKVSVIRREELDEVFPKPHVAVHVNYVDGFQGINSLIIKTRDAQIIADLMLGGVGDITEGELNEIHISAVQEAMNQMMGSSATSMSTIFNRFVNISPPGIDILDISTGEGVSNLPPVDTFVKISFSLKIGELIDSTIMQLLPVHFAKELVATLMGGTSAPDVIEPVYNPEPDVPAVPQTPPPAAQQASQAQQMPPQQPYMQPQQPYMPPMQEQPTGMPMNGMGMPMGAMGMPQQPQTYGAVPGRNVNVQPVQFGTFQQPSFAVPDDSNLNLLLDIPLKVTVELGRTQKQIKEILELSQGSIIELDKLAGEPVDILVNNKLIAKGEVVVIDENFGVRVTDIVSQWDRIQKLQ